MNGGITREAYHMMMSSLAVDVLVHQQRQMAIVEMPCPSLLSTDGFGLFVETTKKLVNVLYPKAGDVLADCVLGYAVHIPTWLKTDRAGYDQRLLVPPLGINYMDLSLLAACLRVRFASHIAETGGEILPANTITVITTHDALQMWSSSAGRVLQALQTAFADAKMTIRTNCDAPPVFPGEPLSLVIATSKLHMAPHVFVRTRNVMQVMRPIVIIDSVASWPHYEEYFVKNGHPEYSLLGVDWTLPFTERGLHPFTQMVGRSVVRDTKCCVVNPSRLVIPSERYTQLTIVDQRQVEMFELVVYPKKFLRYRKFEEECVTKSQIRIEQFVNTLVGPNVFTPECVVNCKVCVTKLLELPISETLKERLGTLCVACHREGTELTVCCGRSDFCQECLDTWYKTNGACPTCRTTTDSEADMTALARFLCDMGHVYVPGELVETMRRVHRHALVDGKAWSVRAQLYALLTAFDGMAAETGHGFRVIVLTHADAELDSLVKDVSDMGFEAFGCWSTSAMLQDKNLQKYTSAGSRCVVMCTAMRQDGDVGPWNVRRTPFHAMVTYGTTSHPTPLLIAAMRAALRSTFNALTCPLFVTLNIKRD